MAGWVAANGSLQAQMTFKAARTVGLILIVSFFDLWQ